MAVPAGRGSGDLAVSAEYNARARRLRIELASGVGLAVPVDRIEGLARAKASVIRSVRIEGGGYGLYWPALDLDVSVPGLGPGASGRARG